VERGLALCRSGAYKSFSVCALGVQLEEELDRRTGGAALIRKNQAQYRKLRDLFHQEQPSAELGLELDESNGARALAAAEAKLPRQEHGLLRAVLDTSLYAGEAALAAGNREAARRHIGRTREICGAHPHYDFDGCLAAQELDARLAFDPERLARLPAPESGELPRYFALRAELARGEIELAAGRAALGHERLTAVAREAEALGEGNLAAKAKRSLARAERRAGPSP
jgi:hypothetical protein